MQEYEVEIEEILQRKVKVEAENRDEAVRKVIKMYRSEEIILGAEDCIDVEFK